VLILGDLLPRSLILLDFKSFIISDLIKNEEFAEVLILDGLGRAVGTGEWIRAGEIGRDPPAPGWSRRGLITGGAFFRLVLLARHGGQARDSPREDVRGTGGVHP
jgi:hypothetical protein